MKTLERLALIGTGEEKGVCTQFQVKGEFSFVVYGAAAFYFVVGVGFVGLFGDFDFELFGNLARPGPVEDFEDDFLLIGGGGRYGEIVGGQRKLGDAGAGGGVGAEEFVAPGDAGAVIGFGIGIVVVGLGIGATLFFAAGAAHAEQEEEKEAENGKQFDGSDFHRSEILSRFGKMRRVWSLLFDAGITL